MCTKYILVHMVDRGYRQSNKPTGMAKTRCTARHTRHTRLLPAAHPGEPIFLAVEQLAELWCVSVVSVYREVHAGALPAIRIGDQDKGRLVIPAQAIEHYQQAAAAVSPRPYHRLGATARFLGVSYGHLLREVRADRFPAVRLRSLWLVPTPAIDVMVQAALDRGGLVLARDFHDWPTPTITGQPATAAWPADVIGRDQPAVS